MNKAALNIGVQVSESLLSVTWMERVPRSGIAGSWGESVFDLPVLQSGCPMLQCPSPIHTELCMCEVLSHRAFFWVSLGLSD